MTEAAIEFQQVGPVLRVRLNRPDKRNALTRSMLEQLLSGLRPLPTRTRILVLEAAGPVFCAGMDLQEMQSAAHDLAAADLWLQDAYLYRQVLETLLTVPCPTLCLMAGPALAGGVGLVLACDLVLATPAASLSLPEPRRGITASVVLPLLRQRVNLAVASALLLSGEALSAESAAHYGLIHALADSAELPRRADALLASVLSGAPHALAATKAQLQSPWLADLLAQWDTAVRQSAAARAHPEAREGLDAFLARRDPAWRSS